MGKRKSFLKTAAANARQKIARRIHRTIFDLRARLELTEVVKQQRSLDQRKKQLRTYLRNSALASIRAGNGGVALLNQNGVYEIPGDCPAVVPLEPREVAQATMKLAAEQAKLDALQLPPATRVKDATEGEDIAAWFVVRQAELWCSAGDMRAPREERLDEQVRKAVIVFTINASESADDE